MTHTPIILIPGLGASPRTYAQILPELWKRASVTIANQTQHDSMEALAKSILDAAPARFALIGHSMGGYIAFEIMRQAPERVERLALMNTSARPDTQEGKDKRLKQIEQVKNGQFDEIIEAALPSFVHPAHQDDEALKQTITSAYHDAGSDAYIRQQTAIMNRKDSRPGLGDIRVPTLILTGDQDTLIPLEPSQELATGIEGARSVIINQSGHMAALEQPNRVASVLTQWLEQ